MPCLTFQWHFGKCLASTLLVLLQPLPLSLPVPLPLSFPPLVTFSARQQHKTYSTSDALLCLILTTNTHAHIVCACIENVGLLCVRTIQTRSSICSQVHFGVDFCVLVLFHSLFCFVLFCFAVRRFCKECKSPN